MTLFSMLYKCKSFWSACNWPECTRPKYNLLQLNGPSEAIVVEICYSIFEIFTFYNIEHQVIDAFWYPLLIFTVVQLSTQPHSCQSNYYACIACSCLLHVDMRVGSSNIYITTCWNICDESLAIFGHTTTRLFQHFRYSRRATPAKG